jgi:hypothetical protein
MLQVAAYEAGLAFAADDVWFDGYAIAWLEVCDGGVAGHYCTGGFVAEHVGVFYYHGANAALVFELAFYSSFGCKVISSKLSETYGGRELGEETYSMPEMNVTSTDTRALDVQQNLSRLQISTSLHLVQARFRLRNPELVRGVCVNANVRLGRLDICAIRHDFLHCSRRAVHLRFAVVKRALDLSRPAVEEGKRSH